MKKLVLIMLFMLCQVFVVANSVENLVLKTSYIMVPEKDEDEKYEASDLNIVGLGEMGTKYSWKLGTLNTDDDGVVNEIKTIAVSEVNYYDGTKLLKLTMLAKEDEKVKVAATYKINGKDEYVILASEKAAEEKNESSNEKVAIKSIQDNYDDKEISSLELIDVSSYDSFPGHEINDNVILVGIKTGKKQKEIDTIPSNIIVKLEATPGNASDAEGVNVSPSDSFQQFHISSKDGSVTYGYKKYNKNKHPDNYQQLTETVTGLEVKEVFITPKNENSGAGGYTFFLNNQLITLKKGITYKFYGDFVTSSTFYGGQNWVFNMTGTVTSSENITIPNQTEKDDVYIIESEGLVYDADVKMTSGNEALRKRESFVEIDVLDGKGIEIKSIKE